MARRALFIITGVSAWLGGLATAFAVSSCDVDTCMDPDTPGCTPTLPVSEAEDRSMSDPASPTCDKMMHPSVYVVPSLRDGDMVKTVDVDMVWFEHEGRTYEARCVKGESGCDAWLAGLELEGPITVSTEHCDTVVSETVRVGRTEDGCHVDTAFVALEVSTLGCLTAPG